MAIDLGIQQNLNNVGVTNKMPGWQIIDNAALLPPLPLSGLLFGDSVKNALNKLMQSFYNYGRLNWTWTQESGPAAANGGLVKGAISSVACGSFNHNFKWLAFNGLGIDNITNGNETAQFLTMPGGVCIDSKWVGNVCTTRSTFSDLKCYKFYGHYWVIHNGINYDVCYNRTFVNKSEIIWTKLLPSEPVLHHKVGLRPNQIYKLEKPLPEGDYLVMIQQRGTNDWPLWQIVSKALLMKLK